MTSGVWTRATVGWVLAAALLPVVAALFWTQEARIGITIMAGLVVVAFWQAIFRMMQGVPTTPAGAVTVVALTVLAPADLTVWQIVLAISFGTVLGELVFGGWGRNVFSPAAVTLAFLYLSFPELSGPTSGSLVLFAVALAAAMLVATGILAWQIPVAALFGWGLTRWSLGADLFPPEAVGSLAFAAVFLVGDPVASAVTRAGRWLCGGLAGMLAALFATGTDITQALVFAALLASIIAPLVDQGAITAQTNRRRHHRD